MIIIKIKIIIIAEMVIERCAHLFPKDSYLMSKRIIVGILRRSRRE
jgi:hypothetical protein